MIAALGLFIVAGALAAATWAASRGAGGGVLGGRSRVIETESKVHPETKSRVEGWRKLATEEADNLPNVSPALLLAVIARESAGDEDAKGDDGRAFGLMQIQNGAWQDYVQANPNDNDVKPWPWGVLPAAHNIRVGGWYLNRMIELTGSTREGLRAYNAGLRGSQENPNVSQDYADFAIDAASRWFA